MRPVCLPSIAAALVALLAASAAAQTPPARSASTQESEQPPSTYDRIWRFSEWYRDSSNPVVQRVQFTGRFQHDFAGIDADQGEHDEWNVRRLRLGPRVTFFRHYLFHAEVELNPQERDPFYVRLTDLYVQWSRGSRLAVTVGKHSVPFTQEGATSSKELVTVDRSNLANNMWFPQEYAPGVSVSGRREPWIYRGGIYSAGAANRELGLFNGSVFTLAVVGYDFAKRLDLREAVVAGNYVYQHEDVDNTFTRRLDHIASIHLKVEDAGWGVRGDLTLASGYQGQSDLWGLMAMPYLNVTDKFQVVTRFTHVASDDPNGVLLATYENRVVSGRGDEYNEGYIGANYYFYGHKLKFQSGLQYADMNDRARDGGAYSGLAFTAGIRVGW